MRSFRLQCRLQVQTAEFLSAKVLWKSERGRTGAGGTQGALKDTRDYFHSGQMTLILLYKWPQRSEYLASKSYETINISYSNHICTVLLTLRNHTSDGTRSGARQRQMQGERNHLQPLQSVPPQGTLGFSWLHRNYWIHFLPIWSEGVNLQNGKKQLLKTS